MKRGPLTLRVRVGELEAWRLSARASGLSLSDWLRTCIRLSAALMQVERDRA